MCHDKNTFEKEMFEQYPILFQYLFLKTSPEIPLYKYGFQVANGWYDLIRLLASKLQSYMDNAGEEIYVLNIKRYM